MSDKNLRELVRDLRPFTSKTLGSLRISIDDCRSIVALSDASDKQRAALEAAEFWIEAEAASGGTVAADILQTIREALGKQEAQP